MPQSRKSELAKLIVATPQFHTLRYILEREREKCSGASSVGRIVLRRRLVSLLSHSVVVHTERGTGFDALTVIDDVGMSELREE